MATNEGNTPLEEPVPSLFVVHHESQSNRCITNGLLGEAQASGYDLLTASITTDRFATRTIEALSTHRQQFRNESISNAAPLLALAPLTPQDTNLTPDDKNGALVALVSPWIDLGSPDPLIAHLSRQVFALEVAYAAFCGINNIVVHGPARRRNVARYARAIFEGIGLGPYVQLHILLPITGELELEGSDSRHLSEFASEQYAYDPQELEDDESDLFDTWDIWHTIRTMCNYNPKLAIALELPRQLPPSTLQSRWYSEPVRMLVFPHTTFLRNAKGYPVLSKAHQQLLTQYLRLRFPPWVVVADVDPIESPSNASHDEPLLEPTPSEAAVKAREKTKDGHSHLRYLRHLQQSQPPRPIIERFGQGYQDYIQSPLQPLTDNLESITYEVFEKDPVKYEWYEHAVALALTDLQDALDREIIVAIVGAGRGPLVTRVLQASKKTSVPIKCCAVEKNPNAHVLIQRRNATDPLWNNQVMISKSDMRTWSGPVVDGELRKVDILVSELLGSFGDNELSPECLDGVQRVLHPEHGISIPQSYTAYFTPIATPKMYGDLLSRPGDEKWELPIVVMLHQYDYLSTQASSGNVESSLPVVKEAWTFTHPLPTILWEQARSRAGGSMGAGGFTGGDGINEHNTRSCTAQFFARNRGICHGLAGYFETVLYAPKHGEKVELSTNPVTMEQKSKDMISWFPMFFPLKVSFLGRWESVLYANLCLKVALFIPDNAEIEVNMWRQTDDRRVWYEWFVEVYQSSENGRAKVAYSDLHSNQKNACLM